MPQRRTSGPPKVMTWKKASPVLVVAVVFDLVRLFFEFFWFFGPALAIALCTVVASGKLASWTFGLLGTGTAAAACAIGGVAVGALGVETTAPLGTVMAIAVGFAGWLTLGGWLMMTNARIFKENALPFVVSLAVSEVPLVGSLPALTFAIWRMYNTQIKTERAALRKYEEEQRERIARAAQIQGAERADIQQRQIIQREEAEYAAYQEKLAANDGRYEIPDDEKLAA